MGDTRGRKTALLLTIFMMAVGTVGIGLIPGYNSIGLLAPLLLVICRLMQGFAAGGEWGGATAFIVEWSPKGQRGFFGSFQQASVAGGLLLGSAIAALISTVLSADQMESWGWRIPFLLGVLLLPVGIYMRSRIEETPAYRKVKESSASAVQTPGWVLAAKAFGFTILWTVSYYIILYYMPTFTEKYAGLSRTQSLWSNTIGLVILVILIPAIATSLIRATGSPISPTYYLIIAAIVSAIVITTLKETAHSELQ
jgi:MHS family proline/betaine transporter-like MFS transporter